MTELLSPAAQAVKDAVIALYTDQQQIRDWGWRLDAPTVAAALRAATNQVVPEPNDIDKGSFSLAAIRNRCKVRDQLLAIAAELEADND
jgi:hypothetical protein